jgi:hypothetical protein
MAKLIGNLITGDHVVFKPSMRWQQKLKITIIIFVTISLGSFLIWKFINYREESRVTQFLQEITAGQYQQAFASWDAGGSYGLQDFMDDFGKDGYYTKGMHTARVVNSKGQGGGVVVCVQLDNFEKQLPIRVDKDTMKLSYSPLDYKCR